MAETEIRAEKIPGWAWTVLFIIVVALVVIGIFPHAKKAFNTGFSRQQEAKSALNATTIIFKTYRAPVGWWSEPIGIPPHHWYRIVPEDTIRVRRWDGKEYRLAPEDEIWDGEEIHNAVFRFTAADTSENAEEVKVTVLTRPKTPKERR